MSARLLTRDEFRAVVLARHHGYCCVPGCGQPATDAHHLLNRNLFRGPDEFGGYFADNGANLCGPHHQDAERTVLSVEDLRAWCDITAAIVPEHLAADTAYDTWGNPVLSDGTRLPGELFTTEGCQRALAAVLHLFSPYRKAPRTFHLPWSPGRGNDDKVQHDLTALREGEVVITLKMDGESTTIYPDGHSHARSVTSSPHPSRDHIRALAARLAYDMPPRLRVLGENLWATHSIAYSALPALFLVHSIWEDDRCLSWDDTEEWAALMDLITVPVIYRGPMLDEAALDSLFAPHAAEHEGYVMRTSAEFGYADYRTHVAKWVRAGHVQTDEHWLHQQGRTNSVAGGGAGRMLTP